MLSKIKKRHFGSQKALAFINKLNILYTFRGNFPRTSRDQKLHHLPPPPRAPHLVTFCVRTTTATSATSPVTSGDGCTRQLYTPVSLQLAFQTTTSRSLRSMRSLSTRHGPVVQQPAGVEKRKLLHGGTVGVRLTPGGDRGKY